MSKKEKPVDLLKLMSEASPSGFAAALHIRFAAPKYLFQSYPRAWIDHYSKHGYVMQDPTVRWGFANIGATRWSAITEDDPAGVMAAARKHGLKYGVTISHCPDEFRSVVSFCRADREFADDEMANLTDLLSRLHRETETAEALSPADHGSLKQMSIYLTHA